MTFELLDIKIGDQDPPKEFRIFTAGTVVTSKGEFIFDEAAAKSVMAAYRDQGNELMVDYDHASLSPMPVDPALSGRAAGWFALELRDGELWAVNVRWTEPAAEALKRKEWRYMSPAFRTKGKKISAVVNVALTNIPATKRLEPLMAASDDIHSGVNLMASEKVLSALGLPADASEEVILKKLADLQAPKTASAVTPASAPAVTDAAALEAIARDAHSDVNRQNEIGALREAQRLSQVREILRSTDRYTTPAFESLAMAKTPDEVKAMLQVLPMKPKPMYEPGARLHVKEAALTAAELRMCQLLGQDEKALQAHKSKLLERKSKEQSDHRAYMTALAAELGDL